MTTTTIHTSGIILRITRRMNPFVQTCGAKRQSNIADFALLHRQYARRDKGDGTWYFDDDQVKVNLNALQRCSRCGHWRL